MVEIVMVEVLFKRNIVRVVVIVELGINWIVIFKGFVLNVLNKSNWF